MTNRVERSGTGQNTLRIIGGKWRGRKLQFPLVDGLRPTGDRIRETVFNWLAPDIASSRCLDLFAGSGAMGLEALSRGANCTTFVEKNSQAAEQLQQHLLMLNITESEIVAADALDWLANSANGSPYEVAFLDPPFGQQLLKPAMVLLETGNWLTSQALVYIETPTAENAPETPPEWHPIKSKIAGQVRYQLFQRD